MEKYKVTINECEGSCNSDLFKEMLERGDITATRIKDAVGGIYEFTGYANCTVETKDKKFDVTYYATDDGFISSGSKIFEESVKAYLGKCKQLKVVSKSTGKGTTFKVTPILNQEEA